MYWHIGKRIFEEEQQGKDRADYGNYLIKFLSEQLQPEFGSGFSIRQINLYRQFYRTFPIVHTLYAQLSWAHFVELLPLITIEAKMFYTNQDCDSFISFRGFWKKINKNYFFFNKSLYSSSNFRYLFFQ